MEIPTWAKVGLAFAVVVVVSIIIGIIYWKKGDKPKTNTGPLTCDTGYHFEGTTCVADVTCGPNQELINGTCVADVTCDAAIYQQLNNAEDACECVEGYSFDDAGTTCVEDVTCDAAIYQQLNNAEDACECVDDYVFFHGWYDVC